MSATLLCLTAILYLAAAVCSDSMAKALVLFSFALSNVALAWLYASS